MAGFQDSDFSLAFANDITARFLPFNSSSPWSINCVSKSQSLPCLIGDRDNCPKGLVGGFGMGSPWLLYTVGMERHLLLAVR